MDSLFVTDDATCVFDLNQKFSSESVSESFLIVPVDPKCS